MRVGIFLRYRFHAHIFESTLAALSGHCDCLATSEAKELIRFRPHVVLAAEDISYLHLRAQLPKSVFVHTRHGLASKGIPEKSFRAADYVCVTSEFVRQDFEQRGIKPRRAYWTVGYVQMDNLQRASRPPKLPVGKKIILYAPTWHHGLSSLPMFGSKAVELLKKGAPNAFLVIKPHPLVQQGVDPLLAPWMQQLREQCAGRDDVYLVEERSADVMPFLAAADVLVTDASSVQLEYLALDRPMILINNPDRFESAHFDPAGYEWLWRDMGQAVDSVDCVSAAIASALENPLQGKAERARYRKHLFGETIDGCAGHRLAARVMALRESVASEASLMLATPFGYLFHTCLPHLRNFAYAWRRLRSA